LSFQIFPPEGPQLLIGVSEEFLMPILDKDGPDDMFLQDGAPPHFHMEVTDFLNRKFPEKWIGIGGPITWPPRSPDLTSLDFLFWGYIKDATLDLLNNVCTENEYRYDICRATHVALSEHHKM
jgi:hypothetical protein